MPTRFVAFIGGNPPHSNDMRHSDNLDLTFPSFCHFSGYAIQVWRVIYWLKIDKSALCCECIQGMTSRKDNTMSSENTVLDTLKKAGEPLNAGKIAELSGLDRKEVDKAMKKLKKEEKIVSPKRCYWEPK